MAPCIIGVGRKTWHPSDVGDAGAPEPLSMWEEVARLAASDAGAPDAISGLDLIDVVYCQSWQYDTAPLRLAGRLGATLKDGAGSYSGIGGSVPETLVARTMERIHLGQADLGLVVGGEALATVRKLKKAGEKPTWSYRPDEKRPFPMPALHPSEITHSIFEAYLTFSLFDSAERHHANRSIEEHRSRLGAMMAPLSELAASDPEHAWFPKAHSKEALITPTADNRMVAFPYTKTMVAIMDIDMAAAVLIASDEKADELGIPKDKRVYLHAQGYAEDFPYIAERNDLWHSEALDTVADHVLKNDRELGALDLYSCFASSLTFAKNALHVTTTADLSVTGGLPYHGGPGSNYGTHAIAAMTEVLRSKPEIDGLVTGVGMHMQKHAMGRFSARPSSFDRVLAEANALEPDPSKRTAAPPMPIQDRYAGPGTVVAYTVLHGRDGSPSSGALVCQTPEGTRLYATMDDSEALSFAEHHELVGANVTLQEGAIGEGSFSTTPPNVARLG